MLLEFKPWRTLYIIPLLCIGKRKPYLVSGVKGMLSNHKLCGASIYSIYEENVMVA
jgi:hypothetical protein